MNIGFLVNPIAGMGGSLGLKGTDDDALDRAIAMGGIYIAERRAGIALQRLSDKKKTKEGISFKFFTCSDVMGENILKKVGFDYKVVYTVKSEKTTYKDTCEACRRFMDKKVDIILFCGGDGTAKDVYSVTKKDLPILGIPSGVKMYSSVFAIDPTVAGDLLSEFCRKDNDIVLRDAEIVDIDEEEYRTRGDISIDIIGYATTIYKPFFVQDRKTIFYGNNEERCRRDIAKFISEVMLDGILYIIGPGNTTKSVTDELNIKKTMLGVDIIKDGRLVGKDVNEREILDILEKQERLNLSGIAKIIVSPIGTQGFIFGRGNQQISSKVIRKVGIDNIIVIATPQKLRETPYLFVDTGDTDLDKELAGYISVISGYRMAERKRVVSPRLL
ncbi:MAG: ATP-NAD kinase [Candidatus Methanoliparum thermophilum]|uniref:ATP-NAD kinase n=1 Tax=Methanoliparum thermophilum TaxID=2491083 RepID=A0A520KT13_METT2|nr:ATP-NAD kinase family protein [Candidatus Methanoliparum sp. LAM-1]RZN65067.1 MAG: ATP-NAD kinase [Candidatus Methanoliparum thermophilum]BDC36040.1 ATP-NAD kinase [Candidatus Methanoliparum sp. LAM-1]